MSAPAEENAGNNIAKKNTIQDELIMHKSFKHHKPHKYKKQEKISDELLKHQLKQGDIYMLEISKTGEYELKKINDELISDEFISNAINSSITRPEKSDMKFIERTIVPGKIRKIKSKKKYDFTKKQIPIDIKLVQNYDHKLRKLEGDTIEFITQNDIEINKVKYPKGTIVLGRIETLSPSDRMGTPESVKIDNFFIDNDPTTQADDVNLSGSISKDGANRSIWVYPLYQAGNIMFYVAGFVFVPIRGGHAKISTDETYTLFYETP